MWTLTVTLGERAQYREEGLLSWLLGAIFLAKSQRTYTTQLTNCRAGVQLWAIWLQGGVRGELLREAMATALALDFLLIQEKGWPSECQSGWQKWGALQKQLHQPLLTREPFHFCLLLVTGRVCQIRSVYYLPSTKHHVRPLISFASGDS